MRQVFAISNLYYRDFENIFNYVPIRNIRMIFVLASGACFVSACIHVLGDIFRGTAVNGLKDFLLLIMFEVFFLISWFVALEFKKQQVLLKFRKEYCSDKLTLDTIKRKRLSDLMNCSPQQFTNQAKELDELLLLHEKYRSQFELTTEHCRNWFFSYDARPRLLTLLVFIASAILVLSVREGATLSTVFEFYGPAGDNVAIAYFFVIFLLACFLATTSFTFKVLIYLIQVFFWRLDSSNKARPDSVRYLISDLIYYHQRPPFKLCNYSG